MNPNDQQREFDQSNEPAPSNFGSTPQSENSFSAPADFSSNTEPVAPTPNQAPEVAASAPQSFGQPTEANPQYATPQPAFPAPEVAPVGQPPMAPVASGENPGQTLGIVSIVMSVIGLSVVGIILGVVSRKKSKAVGASSTLGTVGMVVGIVLTALSLLVFLPLFIIFFLAAANGVQEGYEDASTNGSSLNSSSEDSSSEDSSDLASQAKIVASNAEAYKGKAGDYPKYKSDFATYPESTIDSSIYVYTTFVTSKNVSYLYCGPGAAQVLYYKDAAGTELAITPLGTASSTESCVKISQ